MQSDSSPTGAILFRISSVMEMLDICRSTVYRMVERGELEMVHLGSKSSRITSESVRQLIEQGKHRVKCKE